MSAKKTETSLTADSVDLPRSADPTLEELNDLWARHHGEWRDSSQVVSQWDAAAATDPTLLQYRVKGKWWETLAELGITLLVTREYEHLIMALGVTAGKPDISFMRMPHPSGLVVNREANTVHVASTRNPNQVYTLKPVSGNLARADVKLDKQTGALLQAKPLVPVASRFYPGSLYMHDLALINNQLYANAVGQNAVIHLKDTGDFEQVWWPKAIDTAEGPVFSQNHIQLNSIAAGSSLETSFFSASVPKISARRPGHKNFPVNKRGIIFSGATREPIAYGLTRPHSARLHRERTWVDNSGYGELCLVEGEKCLPVNKLPGWTRGLSFHENIAFVGTSRVIPRFSQYAPGLDVQASQCGLHAIDIKKGEVLGSLIWPYGNQIFAIDWLSNQVSRGFPFPVEAKRVAEREKILFYTYLA